MAKSTGKIRPLPTSWAHLSVLAEAYDEPEPNSIDRPNSPGLTSLYEDNKVRVIEAISMGETSS